MREIVHRAERLRPKRHRVRKTLAGLTASAALIAPMASYAVTGSVDPSVIAAQIGNYFYPFPPDPCLRTHQLTGANLESRQQAIACVRQYSAPVVLFDNAGLPKTLDAAIASATRASLVQSDPLIEPAVVVVTPPDPLIDQYSDTKSCGTPVFFDQAPSAQDLRAMPQVANEYPNSLYVTLDPQNPCGTKGPEASGVALESTDGHTTRFATIFINVKNKSNKLKESLKTRINQIGNVTAHEIFHLLNLGHNGNIAIPFGQDNSINDKQGNGIREIITTQGSTYEEYGSPNQVMGMGLSAQKNLNRLSPPQQDTITQPLIDAGIAGKQELLARPVGERWTKVSNKAMEQGAYALFPLTDPVTFKGTNGPTTFDMFMIAGHPFANKYIPQGFTFDFLFYSTDSGNVAYAVEGRASTNVNQKGLFTLVVNRQPFYLQGVNGGIKFRTDLEYQQPAALQFIK